MSDQPENTEPATAETTADAANVPIDSERGAAGEAAKYRHRLRDTEKQLSAAVERVETMQRGEAERLAASKLADPQDLWRDGAQLADVLDDAGDIDADKVSELINGLLEAHSHWATQGDQPAVPFGSLKSGASTPANYRPPSWAGALRQG